MKRWIALVLVACAGLAAGAGAQGIQKGHARLADSAPDPAAIDSARRLTDRHPDDPAAWVLLGRALIDGRTTSNSPRLQAIHAFRRALELDTAYLPAWDGLADGGMLLAGADGEGIADDALRHILAAHPTYPGAWERWTVLYRNRGSRERMRRLLEPHGDEPVVKARIATLFLEDERYAEADALVNELLGTDPQQPCWNALRAQSAFEQSDSAVGDSLYRIAIANSGTEPGCLWSQVIGIATPQEILAWNRLRPEQAPVFLRAFWARRNPNLFHRGHNDRIAEHFSRLKYARAHFALPFPLEAYNRSRVARAYGAQPSVAENLFYDRCEARVSPTAPVSVTDESASMASGTFGGFEWNPLFNGRAGWSSIQPPGTLYLDPEYVRLLTVAHAPDIRSVDSIAARIGYNLATGLDDRGIAYLRLGPPDERRIGSDNVSDPFCRLPDLERWRYADIGMLRFFRPNAVFVGLQGGVRETGNVLFRPMNEQQFEAMSFALEADRASQKAPLSFSFWTAQFRGRDVDQTDIVAITMVDSIAIAVVDGGGDLVPSAVADAGVARISATPGRTTLIVNVARRGELGRTTAAMRIRRFAGEGVSDLLLARLTPGQSAPSSRRLVLDNVARGLDFQAGEPIRTYMEVYGLQPAAGRVRYQATYEFLRSHDPSADAKLDSLPGARKVTFLRDVPVEDSMAVEALDLKMMYPVEPGTYLLRVDVRDPGDDHRIGRAQIMLTIRAALPEQ